jgi:hypothetical protein
MPWIQHISVVWPFCAFLAFLVLFLVLAARMPVRAPLAFRQVNVFGYRIKACVAMELARNHADLRAVLNMAAPEQEATREDKEQARRREEKTVADLRKSLKDDTALILSYTLLFLSAALLAARVCSHGDVISLASVVLALVATVADFRENHGMAKALHPESRDECSGNPPPGDANDLSAPIRRWSIVKWSALTVLGMALGLALFLLSGAGGPALMAGIAGCFLLVGGGYCGWLLLRWWQAPGAGW